MKATFYSYFANKLNILLFILSDLGLLCVLLAGIKKKYRKKTLKVAYYLTS